MTATTTRSRGEPERDLRSAARGDGASVYLLIPRTPSGGAAGWAIKVDHEGYIPRELEFDDAGTVVSVVGEDDYGYWNDSEGERNPPGAEGFHQYVRNIAATVIPADEFEVLWQAAVQAAERRRPSVPRS